MPQRFRLSVLFLAIGSLVAAQSARVEAQQARAPSADARFGEGERLFEAHQYAAACKAFLESALLDPQLGTLLNLALCHEAVGRTSTAMREYVDAAIWAAQRHEPDRETFAREHAARMAARASSIHLELPAVTEGYAITIDGEPLPESRWMLPLFLDPGAHVLRVSDGGANGKDIELRVDSGPSDRSVALPGLGSASGGPNAQTRRALGVTAAACGVVALAFAGYFVGHDGRVQADSAISAGAGTAALIAGGWLYFETGGARASVRPVMGTTTQAVVLAGAW